MFDGKTPLVSVESTKDLSNIVLLFADGSTERFEGLSDAEGVFAGTGENTGKILTGVWIKSGCNHSGDGPGYGEFIENTDNLTNIPVVSIGDAPGVLEPRLSEIVEVWFDVSLSEMVPLDGEPVIVSYATRDGTATAGQDYLPTNGNLIFAPGEITKTVSVIVVDDFEFEQEETFFVDLSSPENALLAKATGTGSIVDDDGNDY
ncbi:MAG: hypothetical protein OEQ74_04185 [Gammaproteobacteria bacterium]|nr:hypothetical protein [Gammaproteobacteria bacterium]